ncbi:MAG: type II secretion system protein [Chthoniobacterales bacterium]
MRKQPHRLYLAFTLTELLAVLAIGSVLSLLLVSSMDGIKQSSEVARSISNLRTMGSGIYLYANENSGRLPVWHDYTLGKYWWEQLLPYAGNNTHVFHSPGHVQFNDATRDTLAESISYGWNYQVAGRHRGDPSMDGDYGFTVGGYPTPSESLVIAEGSDEHSWGFITVDKPPSAKRYSGKVPSLFMDSHVAVLKQEEFLQNDPWFIPHTPMEE